ncbi:MAG TPA: 4a-hydroxytetrahydrobiopterin dehydratase [Solirubrobacteraceae bacterium]|nr:4a-hydroxytetrahydrobiopterin dehydratase [Solirubrobacteraceae bacterium]
MATLSSGEIDQRLADLPGWRREQDEIGEQDEIVYEGKLADFAAAISLVERVAELAEAANHHPDILVHGYNGVRLTLSTHSEGGLTEADFKLAAQIERLT